MHFVLVHLLLLKNCVTSYQFDESNYNPIQKKYYETRQSLLHNPDYGSVQDFQESDRAGIQNAGYHFISRNYSPPPNVLKNYFTPGDEYVYPSSSNSWIRGYQDKEQSTDRLDKIDQDYFRRKHDNSIGFYNVQTGDEFYLNNFNVRPKFKTSNRNKSAFQFEYFARPIRGISTTQNPQWHSNNGNTNHNIKKTGINNKRKGIHKNKNVNKNLYNNSNKNSNKNNQATNAKRKPHKRPQNIIKNTNRNRIKNKQKITRKTQNCDEKKQSLQSPLRRKNNTLKNGHQITKNHDQNLKKQSNTPNRQNQKIIDAVKKYINKMETRNKVRKKVTRRNFTNRQRKLFTMPSFDEIKNTTMSLTNKFLNLFTVVQFENYQCVANGESGQYYGMCYYEKQCSKLEGTPAGLCADGYGVCCIFKRTCGESSNQNLTYFESPNYPNLYPYSNANSTSSPDEELDETLTDEVNLSEIDENFNEIDESFQETDENENEPDANLYEIDENLNDANDDSLEIGNEIESPEIEQKPTLDSSGIASNVPDGFVLHNFPEFSISEHEFSNEKPIFSGGTTENNEVEFSNHHNNMDTLNFPTLIPTSNSRNRHHKYYEYSINRQDNMADSLACIFWVYKTSPEIQQMKIDFLDLELSGPNQNGDCMEEKVVVSGQNIDSPLPVICGYNTRQHIYVDVSLLVGPLQISILSNKIINKRYKMLVSQIATPCKNSHNCLQYFARVSGTFWSFNYEKSPESRSSPQYMNNLNYAICIRREVGYCSITYDNGDIDADVFDIETSEAQGQCLDDYIVVGDRRMCGGNFEGPITDDNPGPLVVQVRSNSLKTGRGFKLHFRQNKCPAMPM